ncbi:CBS domain-containing protein [Metallosphaera tengchongensis]|uniref:CBS domain-containing protein n=1 Tax=Metallosphaera tengchongensis TaxID=1532350 RepID=A0A6N0NU58_9CREN|nr:CBS domain-containing protein [Metallosphaera tengchongensis]QKR00424.1 CBS domain-containing protein [Metallosphaera tengchongensis]
MGIVREFMPLRPFDTLLYASKIMVMEHVPKSIVIDENGRPVGAITQKDIVKFVYSMGEERAMENVMVSEVMRKDVVCVNPNIDAFEAAQIIVDKRQPLLAVCDDNEKAVGIIIKSDLSNFYATQVKGIQKVKEFMSSPVITIEPSSTLGEAVEKIIQNSLSRLVVFTPGRVLGVITTTDLLYMAPILKYKDLKVQVRDVMSPNVIVVDENEDMSNAARLMASRKIKGIPVMERTGKLAGIVTTTDVVKALMDQAVKKYLYEIKMYTSSF